MRRARNSTGIKHIQLRNNTHTPNKSEKALGRIKQCLEGKRQGRAVSLPHSEILTLPLFPVWSPKSFFVCRTTFFLRGMSNRAEKQQASKSSSSSKQASTLLIQQVSHTSDNSTSHRRLGTHTLSLSLPLFCGVSFLRSHFPECQCLFLMRFIYLKARLSDAYRSIPYKKKKGLHKNKSNDSMPLSSPNY